MCQTDPNKDGNLIFGLESGDILYCTGMMTGWISSKSEQPKKLYGHAEGKNEGPITSMVYSKNVFAWSTKDNVRTKYYEQGLSQAGKGICAVANPLKDAEQRDNL